MRRLVLGLALSGCVNQGPGDDAPFDGRWRAAVLHTLTLRGGWYEAGDPDAVGTCTEAGAYHLQGDLIMLVRNSEACPGAPVEVQWRSDELWRDGGALIYRRSLGEPTDIGTR